MPNYQKHIVYLSDEQRQELFTNGSITVNGRTITYSDNDMYVTPQETPYVKPANGIPASDLASGVIPAVPVQDVQVNGTSILSNGVANINAVSSAQMDSDSLMTSGGVYTAVSAIFSTTSTQIKAGANSKRAISPLKQHESTFYGLAKAAGDATQSQSDNAVGTYTSEAKAAIRTMLGAAASGDIPSVPVTDVQVNGTSVLQNGVANIPRASGSNDGVVRIAGYGLKWGTGGLSDYVVIDKATDSSIKESSTGNVGTYYPIVPANQHLSTFYGLAKAAGDSTQSSSSNAVGTYTSEAKAAIRTMLGAANADDIVAVQDTQPTSTDNKIWLPETAPASVEVPTVAEMNTALAGKVSDVQVNGTSVVTSGVANVPYAQSSVLGVVKAPGTYGISVFGGNFAGILATNPASSDQIKAGDSTYNPISPVNAHATAFYGLAKAAGDSTQSASSNAVGTYTDSAKAAIQHMLGTDINLAPYESDATSDAAYAIGEMFMLNGKLHKATAAIAIGDTLEVGTNCAVVNASEVFAHDVQVNGTSVLSNGVANVPKATTSTAGVIIVGDGLQQGTTKLLTNPATLAQIKAGIKPYEPIVPSSQHASTFYGLATAAGDTTQSQSSNAVGTYTDNAKLAIQTMLGIDLSSIAQQVEIPLVETISGTTPSITGQPNTRYNCGEVSTITITPPASGSVDVIFESGSTAAVLTVPNTVKWPSWFDATSLDTDTIYEILITDGVYGSVMTWAA